jgi:hypothetical protein
VTEPARGPERRARRDERRARRRRIVRVVGLTLGAVLLFVIGLSLGRAIEDAPQPGGEQTIVRTLTPGTLPPVTRTVTVTTTP